MVIIPLGRSRQLRPHSAAASQPGDAAENVGTVA
jgi:hypothetical protein